MICPEFPEKTALGARMLPLKPIKLKTREVALLKLKIALPAVTPCRLMEPPENESEAPETLTITVDPAGAVMLTLLLLKVYPARLKTLMEELTPVSVKVLKPLSLMVPLAACDERVEESDCS